MSKLKSVDVLVAEANDDDFGLFMNAVKERSVQNRIQRALTGEEVWKFLRESRVSEHPRFMPGLLFLNMHLPELSVWDFLKEIKADDRLRKIPLVVLGASASQEEIKKCYDLGVASFIQKPASAEAYGEFVRAMNHYWMGIVQLPSTD